MLLFDESDEELSLSLTYLLTYNVAMDTVVNKWKTLIG